MGRMVSLGLGRRLYPMRYVKGIIGPSPKNKAHNSVGRLGTMACRLLTLPSRPQLRVSTRWIISEVVRFHGMRLSRVARFSHAPAGLEWEMASRQVRSASKERNMIIKKGGKKGIIIAQFGFSPT